MENNGMNVTREDLLVESYDTIASIMLEWADSAMAVYDGLMTPEEAFRKFDAFLKPIGQVFSPMVVIQAMEGQEGIRKVIQETLGE